VAAGRSGCDAGRVTSDTSSPAPHGTPWSPPGWLVPAQGAALAAHLLPGGPRLHVPALLRAAGWVALVSGGLLMAAATGTLGKDLTASPTPRAGARLRTDGVYSLSRHPLYTGTLLTSTGAVLVRGRLTTALAAVVLAGVLHVKAGVEDRVLAERFGQAWRTYAARVPRLLPHPRALSTAR
jgi:protein-S-isoprenylcysteine O-methyltransferase Ste14